MYGVYGEHRPRARAAEEHSTAAVEHPRTDSERGGVGDAGGDGMKTFEELFDADGKYITDNRYQEILRLDAMLTEKQIPHTCQKFMDGWQVIYPQDGKKRVMDAIEHFGSYGNEQDKLEIMGLLTPEEKKNDTVLGYLSAEEVFSRIDKHWKEAQQ